MERNQTGNEADTGQDDDVLPVTPTTQADGLLAYGDEDLEALRLADRFHARPSLPVLIEGETGTGKELYARRVHHGGDPAGAGPFIAVNCAAIPADLFEAELFGYVPGAFSGAATAGSPGKIALASGGTLFLDEVTDLSFDHQAKLLRAFESRCYYPVGGTDLRQIDARIVCACNTQLLKQVRKEKFRADLYYRLKVASLHLPPLRERPETIPSLVVHFLAHMRARGLGDFDTVTPEAMQALCAWRWPGNIRQLRHALEEIGALFDGPVLEIDHVDHVIQGYMTTSDVAPSPISLMQSDSGEIIGQMLSPQQLPDDGFKLDDWIAMVVTAALEKHNGSPTKTATYLGVTRKVLYTLRKRYGLL